MFESHGTHRSETMFATIIFGAMEGLSLGALHLFVGQFYESNRIEGKLYAVTHFMKTQMRRSTFHVIIYTVEHNILLEIIVGQGWLSVKILSK